MNLIGITIDLIMLKFKLMEDTNLIEEENN